MVWISLIISIVFLFSLPVVGQNIQIKLKVEPSPLPNYFVLKNKPDTIFAKVGFQKYKLQNGQYFEVKIKKGKAKRSLQKTN
jgi:hypothetical protein